MADTIPELTPGLAGDGRPYILVGDNDEAYDVATLLQLAPGLLDPAAAVSLAIGLNHLARGVDYEVIEDPQAFEASYRERLAAEDPEEPWREGVIRLRDYGTPDFAAISPPEVTGDTLLFFATDDFLGVPYRVTVDLSGELPGAPQFSPLPLEPLPGPSGTRGLEPPAPASPAPADGAAATTNSNPPKPSGPPRPDRS